MRERERERGECLASCVKVLGEGEGTLYWSEGCFVIIRISVGSFGHRLKEMLEESGD